MTMATTTIGDIAKPRGVTTEALRKMRASVGGGGLRLDGTFSLGLIQHF